MECCDLLIQDTIVLARSIRLMEHVDIAIKDGKILEVGESLKERFQAKAWM